MIRLWTGSEKSQCAIPTSLTIPAVVSDVVKDGCYQNLTAVVPAGAFKEKP
jgi:hypothetical protein